MKYFAAACLVLGSLVCSVTLGLISCRSISKKPYTFYCSTPFGPMVLDSEADGVEAGASWITIEKDGKIARISRSLCMEVRDK